MKQMAETITDQMADWSQALIEVGVKPADITVALVNEMVSRNLKASDIGDGSFDGYYPGTTEEEAGVTIAKTLAGLHMLQEFIEECVDWEKAWKVLQEEEGYFLVKSVEQNYWGLFAI